MSVKKSARSRNCCKEKKTEEKVTNGLLRQNDQR